MPTLFTRIINQEVPSYKIYEDEYIYAFLDINPLQPGHTLVVPKLEVDKWYNLPKETINQLMSVAQKLSPVLEKAFNAVRIAVIIEGIEVPHTHIHLIPLIQGDTLKTSHRGSIDNEKLEIAQKKIINTMQELL